MLSQLLQSSTEANIDGEIQIATGEVLDVYFVGASNRQLQLGQVCHTYPKC